MSVNMIHVVPSLFDFWIQLYSYIKPLLAGCISSVRLGNLSFTFSTLNAIALYILYLFSRNIILCETELRLGSSSVSLWCYILAVPCSDFLFCCS